MKTPASLVLALLAIILLAACGTPSPFPLSFPSSKNVDDRIVGNWKMEEDTNKDNFYEVKREGDGYDFQYHVRFFNRGGTNPTYEANIFFSDINGIKFLNVPYFEEKADGDMEDRGYFFVRILDANTDFTKITTATVNDPALSNIKSKMQLDMYMSENYNNPRIYSDTAHFYKVPLSTAQMRKPHK